MSIPFDVRMACFSAGAQARREGRPAEDNPFRHNDSAPQADMAGEAAWVTLYREWNDGWALEDSRARDAVTRDKEPDLLQ
jgi:hypothetical protein